MTAAPTALLPAGLSDDLPPKALKEALAIESLMATFHAHGYDRIKPPLIEFEDALTAGTGAALTDQAFRVMDPISQRMMAVRADITPQVSRIAASRLDHVPRPLRLAYAGQVLRVRGDDIRPSRQFAQAGLELIGPDTISANVEVAEVVFDALTAVGLDALSLDIALPTLVPALTEALGLSEAAAAVARAALDRKDPAPLADLPAEAKAMLMPIVTSVGPAEKALAALSALDWPDAVKRILADGAGFVTALTAARPDLRLTLDAGEARGFEYKSGLGFTVFARGVRGELGRGGRYLIDDAEPAFGASIYLDTVLRALPDPAATRCIYLPWGTAVATGDGLRDAGWRTVAALAADADAAAQARALGCDHIWQDGVPTALGERN